jgi:succinyl-diaminopimelate desuccinylase
MGAEELVAALVAIESVNPELVPGGGGEAEIAEFVAGWLRGAGLEVEVDEAAPGRPSVLATAPGTGASRSLMLNAHLDTVGVEGMERPFEPVLLDGRLYGRGAYDMKGGVAAMMCAAHDLAGQEDVRVRLMIVPDEESEDIERRSSDDLVRRGYVGDFAITGEPTNLHIGIQAKGVLAARIHVRGRAAHGSTPWAGDNAIVKAVDVFRRIESMPFSRESSEMFDRPSINLGRIVGGDAPNKVPDACVMDVDIRYLPNQDPGDILEEIRAIPDLEIKRTLVYPPAHVSRSNPYVQALGHVVGGSTEGESVSVGRDGASDAVSFLRAGIPAVEFGPAGAGHHGPEEWVSIRSLARYRQLLVDFARIVKTRPAEGVSLRAVEGGAA